MALFPLMKFAAETFSGSHAEPPRDLDDGQGGVAPQAGRQGHFRGSVLGRRLNSDSLQPLRCRRPNIRIELEATETEKIRWMFFLTLS